MIAGPARSPRRDDCHIKQTCRYSISSPSNTVLKI